MKLLRLLANLAIHPDVGPHLASRPELAEVLLTLMQSHSFDTSEELLLNCVCALTNLSFYTASNNQVGGVGGGVCVDGESAPTMHMKQHEGRVQLTCRTNHSGQKHQRERRGHPQRHLLPAMTADRYPFLLTGSV